MALITQNTTYLQNGLSVDVQQVENPLGTGVSQPSLFLYNIIPAAASTDFVSLQQTVQPGVPLTLNVPNSSTFLGSSVVNLDCLRCLSFTVYGGATGANSNVTVKMYDDRNVAVTYTVLIPTGTAAGTHLLGALATAKAGMKVISVTWASDPLQQISIGTSSVLGLPFFVPRAQYILNLDWDNAVLNKFDTTIFHPGYQFNPISGAGAPAAPSALTGDARGLVVLPTAADGIRMMTTFMYVYGADSYLQCNLTNVNQSAITQTQILTTAQNSGQMLERDEVGLQYPGGS